jgi:glycine cleavage system regulatory protein
MSEVVLTLIADDRAGIVETIADVVRQNSGNWLESRMVSLSGKFAGLLSVEIADEHKPALITAMAGLAEQGINISVEQTTGVTNDIQENWLIDIVGQDAPGIVQEISRNIALIGGHVVEISSERAPASMSGEMMFLAAYAVHIPSDMDIDEVQKSVESVSFDLSVEISPIE